MSNSKMASFLLNEEHIDLLDEIAYRRQRGNKSAMVRTLIEEEAERIGIAIVHGEVADVKEVAE